MNNTLCLGIFAALVGFRGLTWQYSAEVTVILLVQVIMGVIALSYGFLYKHTYMVTFKTLDLSNIRCYAKYCYAPRHPFCQRKVSVVNFHTITLGN